MAYSSARLRNANRNILHLALLLSAAPALLTYLQTRRTINTSSLCFVSDYRTSSLLTGGMGLLQGGGAEQIRQDGKGGGNQATTTTDLSGVYAGGVMLDGKGREVSIFARVIDRRHQHRRSSGSLPSRVRSGAGYGWPSATTLSQSMSDLVRSVHDGDYYTRQGGGSSGSAAVIAHSPDASGWCILTSGAAQRGGDDEPKANVHACSSAAADILPDEENMSGIYPPSGVWTSSPTTTSSTTDQVRSVVQVSCPASVPTEKLTKKQKRRKENLDKIINYPTTFLLLGTNIYLAFIYWNKHVHPHSVGKQYNAIVHNHEIWRGYTGAFAHFEIVHLGFNMMSLYSLGEALEGRSFGSVPFLVLNLALVVMTTAIMMGITHLRIRRGNAGVGERYTVGYSGVLFAWMVVTTLEFPNSCPIPFLPDVCFDTHTVFGFFKFNVSPVIQLFVAQMIMPRASFVGHLAGILCGFVVHWDVLPFGMLVPQVLIPGVMLAHLIVVQKVVPLRRYVERHEYDDDDDDWDDGAASDEDDVVGSETGEVGGSNGTRSVSMSPGRRPRPASSISAAQLRNEGAIVLVQRCMLGCVVLSLPLLDYGMTVSQILCGTLFYLGGQAYRYMIVTRLKSPAKERAHDAIGKLLRAHFISAVIVIVADSMTMGSWAVAKVFILSTRGMLPLGFISASLVLCCRMIINLAGLVVAAKVLGDVGEVSNGGVFDNVLGLAYGRARCIGDAYVVPDWNAFDGQGVALGRMTASL